MKRMIIMLLLVVTTNVFLYSQFTVGPKAGVNTTNLHYEDQYLDTENRYGFQFGGFVKYDFTPSWFVQSELMYAQKRSFLNVALTEYGGNMVLGGYTITSNYLLIPVLGGYNFGNSGFFIAAGFQPGIFLDSHYHFKNKLIEVDWNKSRAEDWKRLVFSMVGEFGYKFDIGLTLSARYCHGLTNNTRIIGGI